MRVFPLLFRLDRWMRRKFTPAGGLVLALLVETAAFGINTREVQVYQFFGVLLALLTLAALASLRRRHKVQIERHLPEYVAAGCAFSYSMSVTNLGTRPCTCLWLQDAFHTDFPQGRRHMRMTRHDEMNAIDRLLGYRRWNAAVRLRQGARLAAAAVPPLSPGETIALTLECLPQRRGILEFTGSWAAIAEPLGLLRAVQYQAHQGKVVVLPQRYPVRLPILAGVRRLQPRGEAFASHVGDAEEFSGVRDYRPGDSPRRLHWKAWARSGALVVKEYQEEYFVRQALVLDNFTDDAERFEAAVCAATSLVTADRPQDSLLDLMFVERHAYTFTQGRGVSGEDELLRVLAVVEPSASGDFSVLARAVEERAARLSGVICILLDWDAPRQALVASLRARGVPVQAWLVNELDTPLEPGPLHDAPQNLHHLRPAHLAQDLARE